MWRRGAAARAPATVTRVASPSRRLHHRRVALHSSGAPLPLAPRGHSRVRRPCEAEYRAVASTPPSTPAAQVKQENPAASLGEISKILGEKWKGISDERRANYQRQVPRDEGGRVMREGDVTREGE